MKNKILLIFTMCIMLSTTAFASIETGVRTESDLQISTYIKVDSKNKQAILKTPKVDETEKIYDFANLFTDTEENTLYTQIASFVDTYDLDMAVVTINDNNKSSAMAYADDFYDYNYFGEGTTHDGLLFLIDMDTREMWISTTGEAQLIYDDVRIEKILDATYAKIEEKKYFECAKEFITYSGIYAKAEAPKSNSNMEIDETGDYVREAETESSLPFLKIGIIAFVISGIIIAIAASRHRTIKKARSAKSYINKDSIQITKRRDDFLHTHTSKVRIESSSSSGGGSSTHHSSSGRSHGGGGRSF